MAKVQDRRRSAKKEPQRWRASSIIESKEPGNVLEENRENR